MSNSGPKRSESDVYDRQIRLWGAEAQAKIAKSRVLYIHLTGVSQEILKNLVLAGVRATLCDARPYPDAVLETPSFFLLDRSSADKKLKYASVGHACRPAVEELNPLLGDCPVLDAAPEELTEEMLRDFDMIVASRIGMEPASRIAKMAPQAKFYLVDCFGWNGAAVVDLGGPGHTYREEVGKKMTEEKKIDFYVPIGQVWKVPLKDLTSRVDKKHPPLVWLQYRSILQYQKETGVFPSADEQDEFCKVIQSWIATEAPEYKDLECFQDAALRELAVLATSEVSPVCAVLGGLLGNELIKGISGKGEPANNGLIFSGMDGKCRNLKLKPKNGD